MLRRATLHACSLHQTLHVHSCLLLRWPNLAKGNRLTQQAACCWLHVSPDPIRVSDKMLWQATRALNACKSCYEHIVTAH